MSEELDDLLLLRLANFWPEWTAAWCVAKTTEVSAIGAGRILARLAREGRCEGKSIGYMSVYRSVD